MSTHSPDFRTILNVYPDQPGFTCVGTTQKGQRCRNSLNKRSSSDLIEAKSILNNMNCSQIHGTMFMDGLRRMLNRLAYLTLCTRWHRDKPGHAQTSVMVARWLVLVNNYRQQSTTQQPLMLAASPYIHTHSSPLPNSSATYYAYNPVTPPHSGFPPASPILPSNQPSPPTHYPISPPPSPPYLPLTSSGSPSISPTSTANYPISPPPSPPHSSSSSNASTLSFSSTFSQDNDSGYSTSHSTHPPSTHSSASSNISNTSLPFHGPAVVFPSPPSSVWSMGPASVTSSQSMTSNRSRRSTHRTSPRSSRSSEQSASSAVDPNLTALASSIVASITPTLVNHLTTVLSNTLGTSQINNHVTAAFQAALSASLSQALPSSQSSVGTERSSRRSSRNSSRGSSRGSSRSSNHSSSSNPAHPPEHTAISPFSSQSVASSSLAPPRPLADGCYICYSALTDAAEAVWCSRCGHVCHSECFEIWTETLLEEGRPIACGYCRGTWV